MLLCLVFTLSACNSRGSQTVEDEWGIVQIRGFQTVRIAVVVPTSSEAINAEGTDIVRGAQLAAQEYGRINGHSIEILTLDGQCSAAGGRSGALSITADSSIVSVVGPVCSQSCEAAAEIYETAHFTTISPSCGSSALTDQVTHAGSFMRTIYDDRHEGQTAARFAYVELGARSAATISDGTSDTVDLVDSFETTFQSLGGTITARGIITSGDADLEPVLAEFESPTSAVIFAPVLPGDAITLTTQRPASKIATLPLIGGRHFLSTYYLTEVGDNAEGIYAVGPVLSGAAYQDLLSQFQEQYGEAPSTSQFAYSYDAVNIIADAIARVAATNSQNTMLIGRQTLREALYQTTTFQGVTGNLSCSAWGDCSTASLGVYRVQNHSWTVIYAP